MDLALNSIQRLIYHDTQPTNQPTNLSVLVSSRNTRVFVQLSKCAVLTI